jgi:hypothetical protein
MQFYRHDLRWNPELQAATIISRVAPNIVTWCEARQIPFRWARLRKLAKREHLVEVLVAHQRDLT